MSVGVQDVTPYETRLDRDLRWALSEASEFFEGRGAVQDALRRITSHLKELGIPYAVAGAMALFRHGYRRFTEDVDILVDREGLRRLHEALEGRGYLPPFSQSKNLRDTEHGVRIDFIVAGGYPGDGKPKPVCFPEPQAAGTEVDGIRYLKLEVLINLKLASGMTNPGRLRDIADIADMVKTLRLPLEYRERLDPFVRDEFTELWHLATTPDPISEGRPDEAGGYPGAQNPS